MAAFNMFKNLKDVTKRKKVRELEKRAYRPARRRPTPQVLCWRKN